MRPSIYIMIILVVGSWGLPSPLLTKLESVIDNGARPLLTKLESVIHNQTIPKDLPDIKMLIFTDWHSTPDYDRTLGPKCMCSERYIGAEDIYPHKVANRSECELPAPASPFGQFGCDAPAALGRAALEAGVANMPRPDAVFILGDFVTHNAPSVEWDQQVFWDMSAQVAASFPYNTKACLIPLGNNDVYPNYFTNTSAPRQYDSQAKAASKYCGLDAATADNFARLGYYNVTLGAEKLGGARVKVLVLNTNAVSSYNAPGSRHSAMYVTDEDPLGQFAWMAAQFADARARGMVVVIQAHIAPAIDSFGKAMAWQPQYAKRYWEIVGEYADVLAAHYFGHWHSAETRVMQAPEGSPEARAPALQVLASISPVYANNPVFYSATVDPARLRHPTFETYTLNLAKAGEFPQFVRAERTGTPDNCQSNAAWAKLVESWFDPSGEESFVANLHQYKAGYARDGNGKQLACTTSSSVFQNCATCTHDCRVAYACMTGYGRSEDEYKSCLAKRLGSLGQA